MLWGFWIRKEVMHQCYSLNVEKTKKKDRTSNADCPIVPYITALNIGVRLSGERIVIEDIMRIGEVDSITNCLTGRKRPWMESSID
jgi:hypothetical protein